MNKYLSCKLSGWVILTLVFSMGRTVLGQGQRNVTIGVGSLRLTVAEGFAGGNQRLVYPREYNVYLEPDNVQLVARGAGILVAAKNFSAKAYYIDGYPNPDRPNKGWVVADSLFSYYVVASTPNVVVDLNHTTVPAEPRLRKYWKYIPPTITAKNEDCTPEFNSSREEIRPSIPTEEMGITVAHTSLGITISESAYILGNPDYDDFAIVEYVFKYTGETGGTINYSDSIQDCYVGIKFYPIIFSDEKVVEKSGGWVENTDDWVDYAYAEGGDTLRVMYGWDGDASSVGEDDEGDPWVDATGAFLCPQYPGMAVLHVDKSPLDHSNDMNQPHHAYVSYGGLSITNALSPGPGQPSMTEIYRRIDEQDFFLVPPLDWEKWNATRQEEWLRGTSDPTTQYSQIGTLSFGPYDFNTIGDSVRIVICYAVGSIGWAKALELGSDWKAGTISRTDKNIILRSGRDSLLTKVKGIKELFRDGGSYNFSIETITEKIQAPPPWPETVELTPKVGSIRVEWSPVPGAVAYRVYRRLKQKFQLEAPEPPADEPGRELYPLVFQSGGEDPAGTGKYTPMLVTTWLDSSVVPAQHYWYYVTAINTEGIESSHFVTRTETKEGDPLYCSCTPYEIPPESLDSVFVVPNPYHSKSVELFGGIRNYIDFVGLPAVCRIRILTQSGELIKTIKHELEYPPSTTETWNMETASEQRIASGLYVYVIDQVRGQNNKPINVSEIGKFVVVR